MRKTLFTLVAGLALATSSFAAADKTIVEIAVGNKDFSTLVSLLKAADLVDTLSGKGPFTVFAPTNAAFAKVPKATLEALGKDKALLTKVLTYHVVSGNVLAADALKLRGKSVATVAGAKIKLSGHGKELKINNAKVIAADIKASNGVIHVIDTVLIPK
ncbi:MAG: fasciclin domain-containing protein [Fimbriimonas sp.]